MKAKFNQLNPAKQLAVFAITIITSVVIVLVTMATNYGTAGYIGF